MKGEEDILSIQITMTTRERNKSYQGDELPLS